MKRREIESNYPNKVSNWPNTSDSYVKLHKALILVRKNNVTAKEEYVDRLKCMLLQTIENGTNIDNSVKICRLIEKSIHLESIYDQLKYLIQQVYQIKIDKASSTEKIQPEQLGPDNFNQIKVDPLHSLKIQCDNLQHFAVWPEMMQPSCVKPSNGFSNWNPDYDSGMRPTFDFQSSFSKITIVDQDMDGSFTEWLQYLRLHKYTWFFYGLSYQEIECIDNKNIEFFIAKVNKYSIPKGVKGNICLFIKLLRDRKKKLEDISLSLDLEVTPNELCEYVTYMNDILHYPIPNKHCVVGDQLQQTIIDVMEKLLMQLLEKLGTSQFLVLQSLIGSSINMFLKCTKLIMENQTFMKQQIDKTSTFVDKLMYQVGRMPKNFN